MAELIEMPYSVGKALALEFIKAYTEVQLGVEMKEEETQMMKSKDDLLKQATKAIKSCHWRKDLGGVSICSGECLPCERAIERGKCDTLIKLFRKTQKGANKDGTA